MRIFLSAVLALSIPVAGQAHEVWIERDGTGPARIYLGEPAQPQPAGGDPEFAKLQAPRIVTPARIPFRGRQQSATRGGDDFYLRRRRLASSTARTFSKRRLARSGV